MKKLTGLLFSILLVFTYCIPSTMAQQTVSGNNFKEQFNRHFQYASRVLELAKAMPADKYSWRPDEDVMSVEEVYTHIARYNYLYPATSLDIPTPADINLDEIESITGKQNVISILEASINHLSNAVDNMPKSKLSESTELYGRTVNGQAVLMQLITHMSEHVGQSIAYARVNGVVPPWNR